MPLFSGPSHHTAFIMLLIFLNNNIKYHKPSLLSEHGYIQNLRQKSFFRSGKALFDNPSLLFYLLGPDVPGEGEHKVMDMIRSFSEKVSWSIGLDGQLFYQSYY